MVVERPSGRTRIGKSGMTFKVQVGPPQIAIHQAETVLVTEPDGQVKWPTERGLYFCDTRVISAWTIYANGEQWDLLNGGAIAPHAARVFLTNRTFMSEERPIPARTLGLMIGRQIDGGLHEDIDITNDSLKHARPCEEKRSAPSAVPGWTSFIHPVSGATPRFRVNHAVSARDDCL